MPYKDKEKLKEYQRNWNHTKKGVANRQLRRDARKELVDELKTGPCYHCGQVHPPVCMDLHHVDPSTKEFTVNANGKGLAALKEEAKKCVRLCAICHRKLHAGIITLDLEKWSSGLWQRS